MNLKKLLSNILIIQIFITSTFHLHAQVDIGGLSEKFSAQKLSEKAVLDLTGNGCDLLEKHTGKIIKSKNGGKKFVNTIKEKSNGLITSSGCAILKRVSGKFTTKKAFKDFIDYTLNILTLVTLSVSAVGNKCKVTKQGKDFYPRSFTAGITHWIQKLASLIYIYAEVQNAINLNKFVSENSRLSPNDGNKEIAERGLLIEKEKLTLYERKNKIIGISSLAFGASAALEIGMSAGSLVWGTFMQNKEIKKCKSSTKSLKDCNSRSSTLKSELKRVKDEAKFYAGQCLAEVKSLKTMSVLAKKAKSVAISLAAKKSSEVIESTISDSNLLGDFSSNAGQQGGNIVQNTILKQSKTGKRIASSNINTLLDDEKKKMLGCFKKAASKPLTDAAKAKALAMAVKTICMAPPPNKACPVAKIANCAFQANLNLKGCKCAIRSAKNIPSFIRKIKDNLVNIPKNIAQDKALLEKLSQGSRSDNGLNLSGVTNKQDICGVDYVKWGIRHDLECKSYIKLKDKTSFIDFYKNESKFFNQLLKRDLRLISQQLESHHYDKNVLDFLPKEELKQEYRNLNNIDKNKVKKTLTYIAQALAAIKDDLLKTAQAQDNQIYDANMNNYIGASDNKKVIKDSLPQVIDISKPKSFAIGLGLAPLGMLLFPKVLNKVIKFTNILHRNPTRRGLFFFANFALASLNKKRMDGTISKIKQNIVEYEKYLSKYKKIKNSYYDKLKRDLYNSFSFQTAYANYSKPGSIVPMCIDGNQFTTGCLCKSSTCSTSLSKRPNSQLFEEEAVLNLVNTQTDFVTKISQGEVTKDLDYLILEGKLLKSSNELNPMVAAKNFDNELASLGIRYNTSENATRLLDGLKQSILNDFFTSDQLEQMSMNAPVTHSPIKEISTKHNLKREKRLISLKSEKKIEMKIKRKVKPPQKLDDYLLDYSDINQESHLDIFKIISSRYINKKLGKQKKLKD